MVQSSKCAPMLAVGESERSMHLYVISGILSFGLSCMATMCEMLFVFSCSSSFASRKFPMNKPVLFLSLLLLLLIVVVILVVDAVVVVDIVVVVDFYVCCCW